MVAGWTGGLVQREPGVCVPRVVGHVDGRRDQSSRSDDPETHIIQDVFRDGRILLANHARRLGLCCIGPDTPPRELAWFDFSIPEALSADGTTVVFGERPAGAPGTAYLRKTDGSDAIRLGEGFPEDLSPDGNSVLVGIRTGSHIWLSYRPVPARRNRCHGDNSRGLGEANFLPDGRHIAFWGGERGRAGASSCSTSTTVPASTHLSGGS